MCNCVRRELVKGLSKIPGCTPYLVPKLRPYTWFPGKAERRASFENWSANSRQARRRAIPQELDPHAMLLCRMRWLMAAEFCQAFSSFGGLCDQFNLLAMVLNLRAAENVNVGLSYFRILGSRLEEGARARRAYPGISRAYSVLRNRDARIRPVANAPFWHAAYQPIIRARKGILPD